MTSNTKVYDGSKAVTVLVQNERLSCNDSLWLPNGAKSMVSFENDAATELSFFQPVGKEEEIENDGVNDDELNQPSCKKRRLSTKQVQFLEKSFEVENKLEPERKVELAKELGLQPRQVAIWFQNRRARYKTKQLEKDFDALRASYDILKSDYDNLLKENDTMKFEVNELKEKLATKENEKEKCLELENIVTKSGSEANTVTNVPILMCKQEDASSAKSDVLDSSDDSPHYAENNYSSFLEPTEQSDFSQDDDDDLIMRKSFLAPSPFLPKLETCYYDDPPTSSCNLDFVVGEDHTFNFWPY